MLMKCPTGTKMAANDVSNDQVTPRSKGTQNSRSSSNISERSENLTAAKPRRGRPPMTRRRGLERSGATEQQKPPEKVSKKRKAFQVPHIFVDEEAKTTESQGGQECKRKKQQKANGEIEYVTAAQLQERAPSLMEFNAMKATLHEMQASIHDLKRKQEEPIVELVWFKELVSKCHHLEAEVRRIGVTGEATEATIKTIEGRLEEVALETSQTIQTVFDLKQGSETFQKTVWTALGEEIEDIKNSLSVAQKPPTLKPYGLGILGRLELGDHDLSQTKNDVDFKLKRITDLVRRSYYQFHLQEATTYSEIRDM